MLKTITLVVALLIHFNSTSAQIFPQENSKLNYRLIGFSFPAIPHCNNYKIQVAAGYYNSEDSFKKNIILSRSIDTNRIIAEVPDFGKKYTWRVVYKTNSIPYIRGRLYHFSTGTIPSVDTTINRLRIAKPANKYKDAFVFIDILGVLYDMNGRPLWYLPYKDQSDNTHTRDLKLSPLGTITFINGGRINGARIKEIDYNGNILWQKPGIDSAGNDLGEENSIYHHEFTRLSSSHYMALAVENILSKLPAPNDSSFRIITDDKIKKNDNSNYQQLQFGTLIEYDEKGNVVWTWHTARYIMESDLINSYSADGNIDTHDNAFFFDEQKQEIYISFQAISRIIKIKYPEGNVLGTYGKIYNKGVHISRIPGENGNKFFGGQHACKCSQQGYLYLFDNGCDTNTLPGIVMFKQLDQNNELKKIWEYKCADLRMPYTQQRTGGNVIELPDKSLFVSVGNLSNKLFIVNLNKEIVWSAYSEKWDKTTKKWTMIPSYRASIIPNRKDLEQLIWNSEK